MQCARHKEKCEWLEVVGSVSGSGSRDVKGKGKEKEVVMSPRASEKKKRIKKSAAKVVDSNVKIVMKPSDASVSGSGGGGQRGGHGHGGGRPGGSQTGDCQAPEGSPGALAFGR